MLLFLALCLVGVAVGGLTAFVIFWPLALVHLRDRHPEVRAGLGDVSSLAPRALAWLVAGRYRQVRDAPFTGLATPARVAALVVLCSLALSALLWLCSEVLQ